MNKRQKLKRKKREYVNFYYKLDIASEMKNDSIAHKIKSFFELETIQNRLLFKYDFEKGKLLISKKHIMYLLSLCNDIETLNNYDMEIVDEIDIFKKEEK